MPEIRRACRVKRWDTKARREEERRRLEWEVVTHWWRDCCQRGAVLEGPGYTYNEDYWGDLPWPKQVTLSALHRAFLRATNMSMGKLEFAYKWRKISGLQRTTNKVRLLTFYVSSVVYTLPDRRVDRIYPHVVQ